MCQRDLAQSLECHPPTEALAVKSISCQDHTESCLRPCPQGNSRQPRGGALPLALEELAECLPSSESVEAQVDARELGRAISTFVRGLKKRDGDLFLRRYFYMDTLDAAAAYVGMEPKHAAVSLHRSRKRLEEYLRKEGFL